MSKIWSCLFWTVIILNIVPVCLFGVVFALAYQRGGSTQNIDLTQTLFA